WAYDYDSDDGALSNKREFRNCAQISNRPNGSVMDADGCYWMEGVSGWRLVRITPEGGG
ncbi:MAG: SMP-30/gluconolactonase/LRE family protein, partial [Rhodospirillales bacterium]